MAFDLAARKAELAKRKAAAALTESEAAEKAARDELKAETEATEAAELERLQLLRDRWIDEAAEALGPKVRLKGVIVRGDVFVLKYTGASAQKTFEKGVADSVTNPKIDRAEVYRCYAKASIYSWNGDTSIHDATSEAGGKMGLVLKEFPATCTAIANEAGSLAGYATEERKS